MKEAGEHAAGVYHLRWALKRWRPILTAALGTPLVAVAVLSSLHWAGRVFPGFFVLTNRLIPTVGLYSWTGPRAGVPFHSLVVSADDQPVHGSGDVYAAAAQKPPGSSV